MSRTNDEFMEHQEWMASRQARSNRRRQQEIEELRERLAAAMDEILKLTFDLSRKPKAKE